MIFGTLLGHKVNNGLATLVQADGEPTTEAVSSLRHRFDHTHCPISRDVCCDLKEVELDDDILSIATTGRACRVRVLKLNKSNK